jgi:hypothetical protein
VAEQTFTTGIGLLAGILHRPGTPTPGCAGRQRSTIVALVVEIFGLSCIMLARPLLDKAPPGLWLHLNTSPQEIGQQSAGCAASISPISAPRPRCSAEKSICCCQRSNDSEDHAAYFLKPGIRHGGAPVLLIGQSCCSNRMPMRLSLAADNAIWRRCFKAKSDSMLSSDCRFTRQSAPSASHCALSAREKLTKTCNN